MFFDVLRKLRRVHKRHMLGVEHLLHIARSEAARSRADTEKFRTEILSMGEIVVFVFFLSLLILLITLYACVTSCVVVV